MKKRADGRYAAQVYLGKDGDKKKYKTVYGITQKEVKEKAALLKIQMGKGIDVSVGNNSFEKWVNLLIVDKKVAGVSHNQILNLKTYKAHLSTLLNFSIDKITMTDLQEIINRLAAWHEGKKPLAKTTLRKINNFAKQVFNKAIGARVIDYNPALYVVIGIGEASKKREALTNKQKEWIDNTPNRAQATAMLMLYAGLRRGEVLALTWADINLDSATIRVNKAVTFIGNKAEIKPPKTTAGNRVISIPKKLACYLQDIKEDYLYVVHDGGKQYTKSKWAYMWKSYMIDLDIKYGYDEKISRYSPNKKGFKIDTFTPHQLRHTYATMLYHAGVDIMQAKYQLGHSDIKVTLGVYTHLDEEHKRDSVNKLDEYLASQIQVNEEII